MGAILEINQGTTMVDIKVETRMEVVVVVDITIKAITAATMGHHLLLTVGIRKCTEGRLTAILEIKALRTWTLNIIADELPVGILLFPGLNLRALILTLNLKSTLSKLGGNSRLSLLK